MTSHLNIETQPITIVPEEKQVDAHDLVPVVIETSKTSPAYVPYIEADGTPISAFGGESTFTSPFPTTELLVESNEPIPQYLIEHGKQFEQIVRSRFEEAKNALDKTTGHAESTHQFYIEKTQLGTQEAYERDANVNDYINDLYIDLTTWLVEQIKRIRNEAEDNHVARLDIQGEIMFESEGMFQSISQTEANIRRGINNTIAALNEHVRIIDSIVKEIQRLHDELVTKQTALSKATAQLESHKDSYSKSVERRAKLIKKEGVLSAKKRTIEENLALQLSDQAILDRLAHDPSGLISYIDSVKKGLTGLESTDLAEVSGDIARNNENIEHNQRDISSYKTSVESLEERIEELVARIAEIPGQITAAKERFAAQSNEPVSKLASYSQDALVYTDDLDSIRQGKLTPEDAQRLPVFMRATYNHSVRLKNALARYQAAKLEDSTDMPYIDTSKAPKVRKPNGDMFEFPPDADSLFLQEPPVKSERPSFVTSVERFMNPDNLRQTFKKIGATVRTTVSRQLHIQYGQDTDNDQLALTQGKATK